MMTEISNFKTQPKNPDPDCVHHRLICVFKIERWTKITQKFRGGEGGNCQNDFGIRFIHILKIESTNYRINIHLQTERANYSIQFAWIIIADHMQKHNKRATTKATTTDSRDFFL